MDDLQIDPEEGQAKMADDFQAAVAEDDLFRIDSPASERKKASGAGFEAGDGDKGDGREDGNKKKKKGGYSRYRLFRAGISDKGDYIAVKGQARGQRPGEKTLSPKQLRMLLTMAIIHNGWDGEIRIYRGNTIDGPLTNQANAILATDTSFQKKILRAGKQIPKVLDTLPVEPPSWLEKKLLGPWIHERNRRKEEEAGKKATLENVRKDLADSKHFKGEAGEKMRMGCEDYLRDYGTLWDQWKVDGLSGVFRKAFGGAKSSADNEAPEIPGLDGVDQPPVVSASNSAGTRPTVH